MRLLITILAVCVVFPASCAQPRKHRESVIGTTAPATHMHPATTRRNWERHLGESITVEGIAVRTKMGARLDADHSAIWIDWLAHWPLAVEGKRVRVTGTLIKRHDLPILSKEQLALPKERMVPGTYGGKALPEGSKELYDARCRYLLKEFTYSVID